MMVVVAAIVIAVMIALIRKGYDVRLVLMLAGLLLASIAGHPLVIFEVFGKTLSNVEVIGPICSAMGYAYVLRAVGADKELVKILIRPISSVRLLLVPGGVLIGFLTNVAMPSQTAAAAAVGPILLPLMYAAGYSRIAAGATLLIGCSMGGSMLNPGDVDVVSINSATNVPIEAVIGTIIVPSVLSLVVACIVLTFVLRGNTYLDRENAVEPEGKQAHETSIRNVVLACLAPAPIVVLFITQPTFNLVPYFTQMYPDGLPVYGVMLGATLLAMVVSYSREQVLSAHLSKLTAAFFDGMGYGFAKIISIIIAAGCFLAGLTQIGLIQAVSLMLLGDSTFAAIGSPLATWLMAMMSGSGTAPAVSFAQAVLPTFVQAGQVATAVLLGALAGFGASIGRTMSPVSAVMYFVSDLSNSEPRELIRVVALPLIAALATVIIYGLVSS